MLFRFDAFWYWTCGLVGSRVTGKKQSKEVGQMEDYTFSVEWKEETQKFTAKCIEYPCLVWSAETEYKAIEGIKNITSSVESQFVSYLYAQ
jgi:hypothetical protein